MGYVSDAKKWWDSKLLGLRGIAIKSILRGFTKSCMESALRSSLRDSAIAESWQSIKTQKGVPFSSLRDKPKTWRGIYKDTKRRPIFVIARFWHFCVCVESCYFFVIARLDKVKSWQSIESQKIAQLPSLRSILKKCCGNPRKIARNYKITKKILPFIKYLRGFCGFCIFCNIASLWIASHSSECSQ